MDPEKNPSSTWRFLVEPPSVPASRSPEHVPLEAALDNAWRELLRQHMPFHAVPDDERARLLDGFRQLERMFFETSDPDLRAYYEEAYLGRVYPARVPAGSAVVLRHVIMLQAQLMEQAYFALRLDRYANAPTNRGWMNLFRRWAATETFNYWFDQIRTVFSRQFIAFYDHFVRYYARTIDVAPVPHPWDDPLRIDRKKPPIDDWAELLIRDLLTVERSAPQSSDEIPGVFLDSGFVEVAPGLGADEPPSSASPGEKEGHAGQTPPPPSEGSSGGSAPPNT